MIEDVENLGAKLDPECLRNSADRDVLEQGEVEVLQRWASQRVATEIAAPVGAGNLSGWGRNKRLLCGQGLL